MFENKPLIDSAPYNPVHPRVRKIWYLCVSLILAKIPCVWSLAEIPLDVLVKQYAGAYAEEFEWPQSSHQTDDDDMDDTEGVCGKQNCCSVPVLVA